MTVDLAGLDTPNLFSYNHSVGAGMSFVEG